jgi:hypothetical protein
MSKEIDNILSFSGNPEYQRELIVEYRNRILVEIEWKVRHLLNCIDCRGRCYKDIDEALVKIEELKKG